MLSACRCKISSSFLALGWSSFILIEILPLVCSTPPYPNIESRTRSDIAHSSFSFFLLRDVEMRNLTAYPKYSHTANNRLVIFRRQGLIKTGKTLCGGGVGGRRFDKTAIGGSSFRWHFAYCGGTGPESLGIWVGCRWMVNRYDQLESPSMSTFAAIGKKCFGNAINKS